VAYLTTENIFSDSHVKIWSTDTSQPVKILKEKGFHPVTASAFSPTNDNLAVSGGFTSPVIFREEDYAVEQFSARPISSEMACWAVAYSQDARYLAIGCDRHIQVWENTGAAGFRGNRLRAWQLKSVLMAPYAWNRVKQVAFTHDGKQVIALHAEFHDHTGISAWDIESEETVWRIAAVDLGGTDTPTEISDFAIGHSGLLYVAAENGLHVFDTTKYEPME
jgi:WD40 repeat protein